MKPTPADWPRISSALSYRDAAKAIDWLCEAFGFEVRLKVEGEGGTIEHSELTSAKAWSWSAASAGKMPSRASVPRC